MKREVTSKNRRIRRIQAQIRGSQGRPRLVVFRSNQYVYAQIIDDKQGKTLAAASEADLAKAVKSKSKLERAAQVGKLVAERASLKKLKRVVFDRRAYKFHGRVKAVAEAAREGGLEF